MSTYRQDIDGLRAVAIGSVVLFHAFPSLLGSGFVGVDVFFVISGFLITQILLRNAQEGHFSVRDFYERRIRRIFPSLVFTFVAVLALSWWSAYPEELSSLASQMVSGSLFYSNFHFLAQSGYFDKAAESKPLLNLWSLAVEEQFYIFWPWLILGLGLRRSFRPALIGMLVASLAACIYLTRLDPSAAFYLPFTRFWELMAGGLVATLKPREALQRWGTPASIVGATLIAVAMFTHAPERSFPGWFALLPVTGTALVIAAGPGALLNRHVLSARWLVQLGLISYPLYLVHWPVLVLGRLELPQWGHPQVELTALAASVALAALMYRWVEKPLRFRKGPAVVAGLVGALALVVGACVWIELADGAPGRIEPLTRARHDAAMAQLQWQATDEACLARLGLQGDAFAGQQLFCRLSHAGGSPTIMLMGDSTANALYPGLAALAAPRGEVVLNVGNGTCPPILGVKGLQPWNRQCDRVMAQAFDMALHAPEVHTVVMSLASWDLGKIQLPEGAPLLGEGNLKERAVRQAMAEGVRQLQAAGKRVVFVYDTPHTHIDPQGCLARPLGLARPDCAASPDQLDDTGLPFWHTVAQALGPAVCVGSVRQSLTDSSGRIQVLNGEGLPLLRDTHHLSLLGSHTVAHALQLQCAVLGASNNATNSASRTAPH